MDYEIFFKLFFCTQIILLGGAIVWVFFIFLTWISGDLIERRKNINRCRAKWKKEK